MNKLTIENLESCATYWHEVKKRDEEELMIILSFDVLEYFLGRQCTDSLFHEKPTDMRSGAQRAFFRTGQDDESTDPIRRQSRIQFLAETLFSLQDASGIERVIVDIQKGQVQAAFEVAV